MVKKVLNLYSGLGGNRKLWVDVNVTAVEIVPEIAKIYHDFFPDDTVIVADAHQYLLEHYNDGWDFIWSSPPCPTHSDIRRCGVQLGNIVAKYPDMMLYEEIIFLMNFVKCKYAIENVIGYYEPLIKPAEIGRHYLWANFIISDIDFGTLPEIKRSNVDKLSEYYDFNLTSYDIKNKRQLLRNCVLPELGLHIFNMAFKHKQSTLNSGVE